MSAGIVIAEEAGGLVTGSHDVFAATAATDRFGEVTEEILTGRKYVVVRGISPNAVGTVRALGDLKRANAQYLILG